MKISKNDVYSKLFGFNTSTYYRWKEGKRPIIDLIENTFTLNELNDWLENKKISKFEILKEQEVVIQYAAIKYLNLFIREHGTGSIGDIIFENFMDLYFNVLVHSKDNMANQSVFKPFEIQKSSLIYLTKHNTSYPVPDNELVPKLEVGIELLSEFDCYINQFLQSNIMQNFKPMLHLIQANKFDENQKVEALLHIILFHLYYYHQSKDQKEKRELFVDIIEILQSSTKKNDIKKQPLMILDENVSLDALLKRDIDLIEKNIDNILLAIEKA
ncbi:hypothetical protein [Sulfurovum sp.]|jgi:hypothetical protein|uniref:hypothetical protein n=1 Tax=Sulfurovum sp. TaxID=1969726 RepID=UPI002A3699EF|nr:hypothetical protein [Sulfurovum sp.]MDY0402417.1 hypothetical protein [Sulfurovum sp.]